MIIRELRKNDIEPATEIVREGFTENDASRAEFYFKLSLDKKASSAFRFLRYFVAIKDKQVVGISGLYGLEAYPEDVLWLGYFAVKKKFQGQGIGSGLYKYVEELARKMGIRLFCVETDSSKKKAMDFYKKQGFIEGGKIKGFYEDGSDQVYMWKELR